MTRMGFAIGEVVFQCCYGRLHPHPFSQVTGSMVRPLQSTLRLGIWDDLSASLHALFKRLSRLPVCLS